MELQHIIVDLELVVLSALGTIFPAIEATWNPEFQEWVYVLYSLCYVPPEDVVKIYEQQLIPILVQNVSPGQAWEEPI